MSKLKISIVVLACLALAISMVFVGCKTTTTEETTATTTAAETTVAETTAAAAGSAGADILFVQKLIGIPYCNRQADSMAWINADMGMNAVYTGPNEPDVTGQITIIEDALAKGIDGLAVSSNDAAASAPVMQTAMDMGVIAIAWDVPGVVGAYDYEVLAASNQKYGENLIEMLVKYMGTSGEYAIITGGLTAENLNVWIDIAEEYAAANYPDLKLVSERIPTEEQEQIAYEKALEVIKAYPNLKGIIGVSSPAPPGIAKAVQEKGLQDTIAVVGTALPTQCADYVADGSLDAFEAYDPAITTYVTGYIFKVLLDGGTVSEGMEMLKGEAAKAAGLVIPDSIGKEGVSFLSTDPLIIDKTNIDPYVAQGW